MEEFKELMWQVVASDNEHGGVKLESETIDEIVQSTYNFLISLIYLKSQEQKRKEKP
jgi:hypothetical protein